MVLVWEVVGMVDASVLPPSGSPASDCVVADVEAGSTSMDTWG